MSAMLLDTHALVWLMNEDPSLGRQSRRLADAAVRGDGLLVSAMTFWEVAMQVRLNRIEIDQPAASWRQKVLQSGIEEIPVSGSIGILAAELGDFHPDPADRIIVATALAHRVTLLTADGRILGWTGNLDRHNARR